MSTVQRAAGERRDDGVVAPMLPLALFEAIRAHDLPEEVLEAEDLTASLPRRLGLKGIVDAQIRKYSDATARGRQVPVEEVKGLLTLVLRRPDAEAILREAGQRVARRHFQGARSTSASVLRVLPKAVIWLAIRRATKRVLRRYLGSGRLEVKGRPMVVRITSALTARADANGTACAFYSGAIEELVHLYTLDRFTVRQAKCAAREGNVCEWTLTE